MRRPERLAEVLREELTEIVGYELEDPRLAAVTVTDVRVSQDLRDANIFVLVEGDEKQKSEVLTALEHATSFVRRQVALNLDLRHAPNLHFARDTVEENATRIESLLTGMADQEVETEESEEVQDH